MLEKILEELANKYRVVKTDEDAEWNRAVCECENIIRKHISATGHGRLIDADALDDEIAHFFMGVTGNPKQSTVVNECKNSFRRMIEEQPTVYADDGWIPVEERLPEDDNYILLSFANFSLPMVGRYEKDEEGSGAFYLGDCDEEDTCVANDFFVNAWQPLPEPYQPEKKGE